MYVIIKIFIIPNDSYLASQRGASDSFAYFLLLSNSRLFPVWDFVVGIFARKAMLSMGWVLSILN